MPLNYKTCRKIFIYLNKVKMAKRTLEELFLRTPLTPIEQMTRQRLDLLKRFQLDLISFLADCRDQLPFNPTDRCRATVYWFASQKIMETSDLEALEFKMEIGDSMMRSECIHILADDSIPDQLRQLLENHINRIAILAQEEDYINKPKYG